MLLALKGYFKERCKFFKSRYNRTLPFGDTIVDRWEKAEFLGFGNGSSIYDSSLVFGDVVVGEGTWIGPNTILDGSGGLQIGSNCCLSCGVQVYTHDTIRRTLSGGVCSIEHARTTVGDNCYIGPNVIITKGISLGNNVVVGANSLVLNDIPSGKIVYGTPAKVHGETTRYINNK